MRKMRYGIIVLCLLCSVTSVSAQVSIGIGLPSVRIGINLPLYPELVPVPGYPVYYAPRLAANYFFYDGLYWVYLDDYWYASYWYNGPWWVVAPEVVPVFILRIPVRFYRQPPVYFRGWRPDAPPRWGEHWGREWEQHRRGWDRWKRGSAPARAPLPLYQRRYSGDRYPSQPEQQQTLHRQHYRYQPRDRAVRQHFQQRGEQRAPAPGQRGRQEEPRLRGPGQQDIQRPAPPRQGGPAGPRPQPPQAPPQQRGPAFREQREQPGAEQRERQAPRPQVREQRLQERGKPQEPMPQGREQRLQDRERSQEPGRGKGEGQRKDEDRGRERERNN